jgi:hypothetical protein
MTMLIVVCRAAAELIAACPEPFEAFELEKENLVSSMLT